VGSPAPMFVRFFCELPQSCRFGWMLQHAKGQPILRGRVIDTDRAESNAGSRSETRETKEFHMLKQTSIFETAISLSFALFLAFSATAASAELSIEREVSVTDGTGGTLVMLTLGVRDELGGESTTTATFSDFQAASNRRRVAGKVVRERMSTAERAETTYNGTLEIVKPATEEKNERMDRLVFENLTLARDGDGPEISGQVIFNGEMREAADLPRSALRTLARALRFFRFA